MICSRFFVSLLFFGFSSLSFSEIKLIKHSLPANIGADSFQALLFSVLEKAHQESAGKIVKAEKKLEYNLAVDDQHLRCWIEQRGMLAVVYFACEITVRADAPWEKQDKGFASLVFQALKYSKKEEKDTKGQSSLKILAKDHQELSVLHDPKLGYKLKLHIPKAAKDSSLVYPPE